MSIVPISRRQVIKTSVAALAGLSITRISGPTLAFQTPEGGTVIPWSDPLAENPVPNVIVQQLDWEQPESLITPNDEFFIINHFEAPEIDASQWSLKINGLVANPLSLTLDDIKARDRAEVMFTMECSGNTGLPFFNGGIGNAVWAGTPLSAILQDVEISVDATEVVFWAADSGEQVRGEVTITEHFARSMSVAEAMDEANLIAYEMNGEELPAPHGFPARLIAPGWYGIANVKWLTNIEVTNQRFAGHFMARDYVTMREEVIGEETVWTFSTVSHDRLKSAPARFLSVGDTYAVQGAAWGEAIDRVEVSVDGGEWQPATLTSDGSDPFVWTFWSFDPGALTAGEHTISSRAISVSGDEQPLADDPFLTGKSTFWESNGVITRSVVIE